MPCQSEGDGVAVRSWSPGVHPKEGRYGCVRGVEPCVGFAGSWLLRGAETSSECTALCFCGGRLEVFSAEFPEGWKQGFCACLYFP